MINNANNCKYELDILPEKYFPCSKNIYYLCNDKH